MFVLTVLEEDIGISIETKQKFDTETQLKEFVDVIHGVDDFTWELDVPDRKQYDETYYKTFTVTIR